MIVRKTAKWLGALVLLAGMATSAGAGDPVYGIPEPPPNNLRPYSQRSFRFYYLHRLIESHRQPSVESYPVFEVDVKPSYSIKWFPCPYVYPSELVAIRHDR